jgi:hypothetical protein
MDSSRVTVVPRGGAEQLPSVSTSSDTDLVIVKMELEVSEFSKYQVELEDSATRQILWTSARLEPLSDRGLKSVSCVFPAALLKRQNYLVQLSGIRANGTSELVTTYAFRAVVKEESLHKAFRSVGKGARLR